MAEHTGLNNHEHFHELAALANSGTLTAQEWAELKDHLQTCAECCAVHKQYLILSCEGIPELAPFRTNWEGIAEWDETAAHRKLLAHVQTTKQPECVEPVRNLKAMIHHKLFRRLLVRDAVAVGFILAASLFAYRLEMQKNSVDSIKSIPENRTTESITKERDAEQVVRNREAMTIAELQEAVSQKNDELGKLRSIVRTLKNQVDALLTSNNSSEQQLLAVSQQREELTGQLHDAERSYQEAKTELANLRAQRDNESLRKASVESRIDELSATNRDQAQRLKDDEEYLAYDRDIRELMGARKLYIADVFDVDSRSRTQKAFGRIFYTQSRSLLFYAFDLDRQAVQNASTFQAWGRRVADGRTPLSLGIFFKDSESNHRWVLRFDDPKRLAEIDSVFVTIEPHGGSQKPTGKPFLFSLLREEANHP
jgi:hypothetical protein